MGLTCNVNIGWGSVQGGRRPCSAAVTGSDALNEGENV